MSRLLPVLLLLIAGCKQREAATPPPSTNPRESKAPTTAPKRPDNPPVRSCASDSFIKLLLAIQQNQIKSADHSRFDDQIGCKLVLWQTEQEFNSFPQPIITSITPDDWLVFTYSNWSQPAGILRVDDPASTRKRFAQNSLSKRNTHIYDHTWLLQDVEYLGFKTVRLNNGGEIELPAFLALPSDRAEKQKADAAAKAAESTFKDKEGKLGNALCDVEQKIENAKGNPKPLPNPDRVLIAKLNDERAAILRELKSIGSKATECDLGKLEDGD